MDELRTSTLEATPQSLSSLAPASTRPADVPVGTSVAVSVVMPTTAWTGTFETCARRVLEVLRQSETPCEFVVALDGPATDPPAWLDRPDVTVVVTGRQAGPAVARNLAAEAARGRILFFVDADVALASDALDRVMARFEADPDLAAVFGCYDDEPAAPGLVSRFRNLLHHHTHVTHPGRVGTFWAGCGAIRTAMFLDVGGFDSMFGCPSVEDIELGMRVSAAGGRIRIDPGLRCKHLKRWTLQSMILTDIFSRATPWTRLLMAAGDMPATLNIDWRSRVSGVCAVAFVAALFAAPWLPAALAIAACCLAVVLILNWDFYRLCLRKGGCAFAGGAVALHLLYFLYASLTFGIVATWNWLFGPARSTACRSRSALPTTSLAATPAEMVPAE